MDPTHVNAFLARGASLNKIGQYKDALNDYDNALKLDSEKTKFKRSRPNESRRKSTKENVNEDDIMRPNENKFKPLEVDASRIVNQNGQNDHMTQGNTELLIQKPTPLSSLTKPSSTRINEESSISDLSLPHSDLSRDNTLRQADILHSYGWEARKKQEFRKAIDFYSKAL